MEVIGSHMQDINGVFEVETYKSRIVMDNPIQIVFFLFYNMQS